jgi:hypothetical protein
MLGQRGALSLGAGWLAAILATAGAGVGVGLGVTGGVDIVRGTRVLAADAVAFHDCPGGATLGDLHRGDRVYATGRTKANDWLEVRSPRDPGTRVWMPTRFAVPDADTSGLPVVECTVTELALGEIGGTEETDGATTTTMPFAGLPGPSDDEGDDGGSGGSGGGGPSGPSDTTPPSIGQLTTPFNPNIYEDKPLGSCGTESAYVLTDVTDDSGVASVSITWQVGTAGPQSASMAKVAGNSYRVLVGGFSQSTLPSGSTPISFTVIATDGAGNQGQRSFSGPLILNDCT